MPNPNTPKRTAKFAKRMSERDSLAFKYVERQFSPNTLRPFYNSRCDHRRDIKSLKLAKKRNYKFATKTSSQLFGYIGGAYDYENPQTVKRIQATFEEFMHVISSSSKILASDPEARIEYTNLVMKHFDRFAKSYCGEIDTKFNIVTFVYDAGITNENEPNVDIMKIRNDVSFCLNNYSDENAICFAEIQPLKEYLSPEKGGKKLMLHVHAITWGHGWTTAEFKAFKSKCKRFKSSYTNLPIKRDRLSVDEANNRFRPPSYLSKMPCNCKFQNELGRIERDREMSGHLLARHFEILSYIPLKSLIFSVREGKVLKKAIIDDLNAWHRKNRRGNESTPMNDEERRAYWRSLWVKKHKRNYAQPVVKYKREKSS